MEKFFNAVDLLKNISKGKRISNPSGAIDVGTLPWEALIIFQAGDTGVESTNRALKHILEKKDGEMLARATPGIIAHYESAYESRTIDTKTGKHRVILVKRQQNGNDLFAVIEIKSDGIKNQLVTVARVGKNYLTSFKRIR